MNITSISNGVVLDHIPAGLGLKLYELLSLGDLDCPVVLLRNAPSKKLGKKDIIKIDADIKIDFQIVGYVAPSATVNIITDGKIVEKKALDLPETLVNVIKCKNPRCITTTEQEIEHIFKLTDKENGVYRCIYCETRATEK